MLILSIPATPRLRLTLRKASLISAGVILPVNEWALIFLAIVRPFPVELHRTRDERAVTSRPWRVFLRPGNPARVRSGVPIDRLQAVGLTALMVSTHQHGLPRILL